MSFDGQKWVVIRHIWVLIFCNIENLMCSKIQKFVENCLTIRVISITLNLEHLFAKVRFIGQVV